jgi:hypothetical protein
MIHGDACFAYFNKVWGIPPGCCARAASGRATEQRDELAAPS